MTSKPRFSNASSLDVVGIGNAIVDVLVQTEDQFLNDQKLNEVVADLKEDIEYL